MYKLYVLRQLTDAPTKKDTISVYETDNYTDMRTHMTTVMQLDPDYEPRCVRFLHFSDNAIGIDYGPYSRFLLLTSDDKPINLNHGKA